MSTTIRPEVSKKNPYWIDKHRYYELKHFCLQFDLWNKIYNSYDSLAKISDEYIRVNGGEVPDPTVRCFLARDVYLRRIKMVIDCAYVADQELGSYILKGVTTGMSYEKLNARFNLPCCKEVYYNAYRKFFWLLDRERE